MAQLLSLNPSILIKVVDTLALKDVILLASTCRQLHQLIYETADIWNAGMLFEDHNQDIDDEVIAYIVPRITRSYGIHSLKIIGLHKVTSIGILQIFDQFAHALKDIELGTSMAVIEALTDHLEAFSLKLGLLQAANSIPLTFWEYRCHHKEYMEQVAAYMSQSLPSPTDSKNTNYSHAELFARLRWLQLPTKLDDPPFEHLEKIKVIITDGDDHAILLKLRSLIAYLSGANLESDAESDEQKHSEAHADRWHTINRKQKVADIVSKLEILHQPSIAPSTPQLSAQQPPAHLNQQQQQQQDPYHHRTLPALPMVSGACPEGAMCTPYDRQETPIPPSPPSATDSRKRRLAQSEPRLSSEESKRSRRSPSTQPVVKVYRYRRRRSSGFESQSDQERQQHAYRHPVSN
ncbi:hypothetical protein K450DRAFT_226791 [Umbelopsis ramanniana AG]|uniref:F-box domain-containing protein n=1 Tax=Umbelopsis ramanniana AG TaxID=1314678 RepID=A0AAD5EI64_UMBRA|nr:uncharacterized protein K450DRAFT_226791 [Umbelopsis ramanniana AG]KAI8582760.1 hypothetical protein K450DRAFT_226791 [Umbelopsis ramanniana AG]